MSFELSFQNMACFSWKDLVAHYTSPKGGSLRIVDDPESNYAIIRYTRGVSDFTMIDVPLVRSVVWNKITGLPVCVAPPMGQDTPVDGKYIASEFVEGTMVNAWRDGNSVQIATRTSVGARGKFYSSRSFADLLNEALGGKAEEFLSSVLKEGEFVCMVLQHREHKIVGPVAYNRIYVTHFGRVDGSTVRMTTKAEEMPQRLAAHLPQVYGEVVVGGEEIEKIRDGQQYSWQGGMNNEFQKIRDGQQYSWQGVMYQHACSPCRTSLKNPAYVLVRTLRGSEASPMERFLRLRAARQIKQYLNYYREESNQLWEFEQALRKRTEELYVAYNEMNKLKVKGMRDFPYCLRPHIYALHGEYLGRVKSNVTTKSVLKETVVAYVNKLAVPDVVKLMGPN